MVLVLREVAVVADSLGHFVRDLSERDHPVLDHRGAAVGDELRVVLEEDPILTVLTWDTGVPFSRLLPDGYLSGLGLRLFGRCGRPVYVGVRRDVLRRRAEIDHYTAAGVAHRDALLQDDRRAVV